MAKLNFYLSQFYVLCFNRLILETTSSLVVVFCWFVFDNYEPLEINHKDVNEENS